jgi:hypothetical protein
VSFTLSVGVVHQLEAVHVDEHDGDMGLAPFGLGDGQVQAVAEKVTVGEMGKRVVEAVVAMALLVESVARQAPRSTVGPA